MNFSFKSSHSRRPRRRLLFSRHRLLRPTQQLPDLARLHLPVPHLLDERRRLGPPQQALDVAESRPEADAADARAAAVALRALDELVRVLGALAIEGAPLACAAAPVSWKGEGEEEEGKQGEAGGEKGGSSKKG